MWLDPANARIMVAAIADALADADPGNAATYRDNAEALSRRLEALESDIASRLEPYRSVPYYTFHEAFRYFDRRFGLNGRGAIAVSPELQPGAQRIAEIRAAIGSDERVCVFAEPAFPPRLVDVIVEGTNARSGVLDDLGQALTPGPGALFRGDDGQRRRLRALFPEHHVRR
ncbi:MAG: zinc ABC transporter substrate-binding protein [Pseudorhodoplanes sp.]|nr:zinc ABC transporter substrate-binding protein [Pseudorhodoplanes sp.]